VECQSLLLQSSLEIFLKKYLSGAKQCDILVTDEFKESDKPQFVIKDRLKVPFSKSNLFIELDRFVKTQRERKKLAELAKMDTTLPKRPKVTQAIDSTKMLSLEEQIDYLFDKFKKDLITIIKKNQGQ
jgi:hypothetical protein